LSDATRQKLKVSAEGIALIKSLEGFRPRALRRGNQWVIGYGHTRSAREGAAVTEAEAELLLRYDLLTVTDAINEGAITPLNQHQFDALASFAYSVGIDDFRGSDVLHRLNRGESTMAADALIGWPETPSPEAVVRRRSAERALFTTDPSQEASVAFLLTAPLPPIEEDGTILPFPAADETVAPFRDAETVSTPEPVVADAPAVPTLAANDDPAPFPVDAPVADPLVAEPVAADPPVAEPVIDPVIEPVAETLGEKPVAFDGPVNERPLTPDDEILKHAVRKPEPAFDWKTALPWLLIGGAGFIGFGVAMGTLRLSAMPSAKSGEIALSGWLLAALSIGFIGYAGWKMYDRWGRTSRR
jgi:lysozyme